MAAVNHHILGSLQPRSPENRVTFNRLVMHFVRIGRLLMVSSRDMGFLGSTDMIAEVQQSVIKTKLTRLISFFRVLVFDRMVYIERFGTEKLVEWSCTITLVLQSGQNDAIRNLRQSARKYVPDQFVCY
jgi:hypothetical protein